MAEEDEKITIEIKISVPVMSKGFGGVFDHLLTATEEIIKAGRSVAKKPEVKSKIKKVEVK